MICMKRLKNFLIPILVYLLLIACDRLSILPTATPLPLPTELATTPLPQGRALPQGSEPGTLDAIYVSQVSINGGQGSRCHTLYRFYPDGHVLYAPAACFDTPPSERSRSEIERWLNRENTDIDQGDYFQLDQRVFIRIVSTNDVLETINLRTFQGEYCNEKLVLQEPLVRGYSGVPSELTQPVLEFALLEKRGKPDGGSPDSACHVAGFKMLFRPSVALAGGQAELQVQTDPGETCILRYTAPDGSSSDAPGTGTITADSQGVCSWLWELGETEGNGTVTISIDQITQELNLEVR
jgi:hypothetical protein